MILYSYKDRGEKMTRIAGFLRIDTLPRELAHEHHKKTNHYWINIDGIEYYFKPTKLHYNELIAFILPNFLESKLVLVT